jgi:transposase
MTRHSTQFRLEVVRQYLSGAIGYKTLASQHGLGYSMVRRWVESYRKRGRQGLSRKFSHYSAEFKLSVLKRMWREKLSYVQTAIIFDIRSESSIGRWERQYHDGGIDALMPRPRGRPAKMPQKKPLPPRPIEPAGEDQRTREQLLKENEDLRAEVAYLKKLDALIQAGKRPAQLKKHR